MSGTYFETYLGSLEACADVQGVLGQEWVIHPPDPDFGYDSTPSNALTFGKMGVDGVHYAVLLLDGVASDSSPVVQISPMDFGEECHVLAESFLDYLAVACAVPAEQMASIFAAERVGVPVLAGFLRENFDEQRLWELAVDQSLLGFIETRE